MSARMRSFAAVVAGVVVLLGVAALAWAGVLGLRGNPLLVVLTIASLGAAGLLVAGWGRLAGPGPLSVAGRVAAILGCQLLTTLLLLTAVNDWGDFYGSWSDLLGLDNTPPVLHDLDLPASGLDRAFAPPRSQPGRVERIPVTGPVTGLSTTTLAWFPPQYFEPAYAHVRFPVALLLGGYPSHVGALTQALQVPKVMNGLTRTGHVLPMVMIMASPDVLMPRDTECTDIPQGPQVQTFLAIELPRWYAAHYRVAVPGSWGVLGVSTGGFCAAKLVLTHPEVFTAAVSFSGYMRALTDVTTGDLFGGSQQVKNVNDPIWRIEHLALPDVSLLLATSRQEADVYRQQQHFVSLARPPLHVATLIRGTGGHNDGVWISEERPAFQWLSVQLLARLPSWRAASTPPAASAAARVSG